MVAIFTGLGAGVTRSSASSLGSMGLLGSASLGRGGEGVSVNAATGNLLVSQRDEFLTGRGLDIAIDRTYNSLAQTGDRDNGDRWQMGTVRRVLGLTGLLNVTGSTVKRLGDDGSLVTYTYGTRGGVAAYWATAGDGAHEKLVRSGSTWTWTDGASQITETYEAAQTLGEWRILRQTDISGQSLAFLYRDDDLVHSVATSSGEFIQFAYSTDDSIPQILTATVTGTVAKTRYSYDGSGRLSSVSVDFSPNDYSVADGNGYTTSYTYGSNGLLQAITQTDGSRIDIAYDSSDRVVLLTQAVGTGDARVTALTYNSGHTLVQGPDGTVTRLDYDGAGQMTRITAPPAYAGAAAQVVEFGYDADGNVSSVTGADGKVTTHTYDAAGNQTLVTDPNGNTVRRWYDAGNRVTAERTYGAGGVAQYTRYAYDGAGRLRYVVSPDGRVSENRYDANGLLSRQVDYPDQAYTAAYVEGSALAVATMDAWRDGLADRGSVHNRDFTYDFRGNATSTTDWRDATTAGEPDAAGGFTRTHYTHDEVGRLIARRAQGESTETFVYDGLDRLVGSVDVNGGTTSIVFNDAALQTVVTTAGGYTTIETYNKAGDLLTSTGSGAYDVGSTVTYKYDKLGRVRMATDETGYNSYVLYDDAGRKVGDVDHGGTLTEYRYDAANRIIAVGRYLYGVNVAPLADPDNHVDIATIRPPTHYYDARSWTVYDAAGRVIQTIDGAGGVIGYEYDASDRLVKTTSYATKVATAPLIASPPVAPVGVTMATADTVSRMFYDKDGHLVGTLDGEGYLIEHLYDQAGQKIEDIASKAATTAADRENGSLAQLRTSAGPAARRMHYVYEGGLLRFQVDAVGQATRFDYNAAGKLTVTRRYALAIETTDYRFDTVAMAADVASGPTDRTTTTTYDDAGRVATTQDAGGLVTSYGYDVSGNVIKVQVGTGAAARISRRYYGAGNLLRFTVDAEGYARRIDYDDAGRKVREVTWDAPIGVTDTTTIAQVASLVTGTWTDLRYVYNANGQLDLSYDAEGVATIYLYAPDGQVAQVYEAWGTPDVRFIHYQYDAAGNLEYLVRPWTVPEQAITQYAYDGLGNRTSMVDARGNTTFYSYDEVGQLKTVTDPLGGVTSYTYNAFGQVVQEIDPRGAVTTTSYDDDGRVATVTDALGYVTSYTYTAFDEVATVTRAGATTSFAYDKLGRVTTSTDAMGYAEGFTYDALGNRLTAQNKLGGITTYGYDRRGLMVSETLPVASIDATGTTIATSVTNTYAYDARGNRVTMTEAAGLAEERTTTYVYDNDDRLIETVGPTFLGITPHSFTTYDARGNVTSRTDPTGARTVYFNDDADRVVAEISAVGTYTAYDYDLNGNVTATRVYATPVSLPADGGAKDEAPAAPSGDYRETAFTYDKLNRLILTEVADVVVSGYDGTVPYSHAAFVRTYYAYDAAGNVERTSDGRGGLTLNWYDLLGRRTHQRDAEGYVTAWSYDGEGRVLTETRFANSDPNFPPSFRTPLPGPVPAIAAAADDRITSFTYDLSGNRLTETRAAVLVHDGSGGHVGTSATVGYLYNGLGQVVRKTEATGDQVAYTYDTGGRLTVEQRAAFVDHSGVAVTPTVDYYYDGLGNLSRTRARGSAAAADRTTTYGYSGGMLAWMEDAEVQDGTVADGKRTEYTYDAAGRTTWTRYQRYDSSGTLIGYEADAATFDAAGRMTASWKATQTGTSWAAVGPINFMAYNAFGEVATISAGDGVNPAVVQQQNRYDNAGRLIATTAGDGVWKHYGHDANGNQTIAITSAGDDLTGLDFAGALALVGSDGVNATYTRYDDRNLATIITEEGRHLSTTDAAQTLTTTRRYTAFGEVASETNAAGATIDYAYNTAGRLIRTESPAVSITLEDGTVVTVRPTEQMYYDAAGRLVATRDANGNLTRQTLLAGTGYGGGTALVVSTLAADGGLRRTGYDVHGDARVLTDELGHVTLQDFDKLGRLTLRQALRDPATTADDHSDTYAWDGLGQQLRHGASWTLAYGAQDYEVTEYDALGRVTTSVAFGGDTTTTSYVWSAAIATAGVGTFGGWTKTTTMANGRTSVMTMDMFDRATGKTDLGGNVTTYGYDVAGRMTGSTMTNYTTTNIWLNSGKLGGLSLMTHQPVAPADNWTRDDALYAYDLAGNRILEALDRTISGAAGAPGGPPPAENPGNPGPNIPGWKIPPEGEPPPPPTSSVTTGGAQNAVAVTTRSIKNQSATYDALGRLTSWAEAGTDYAPAASLTYDYDAAGNIRRTRSSFATLDATGTATPTARDQWFRFDSMNRMVVDQGELVSGVITGGAAGREVAYDVAGRRVSVTSGGTTELYGYDAANRVTAIFTKPAGSSGTGTLRSQIAYDAAGRLVQQQDYAAGGTLVFDRVQSYDAAGRIAMDATHTLKDDGRTYSSATSYGYGAGTPAYALGAIVSQVATGSVSGTSGSTTATTTYDYVWYDGAQQSHIGYSDGTTSGNTYFAYDGASRLRVAEIQDGKPRYVDYVSDELGQVIYRREIGTVSGQVGNPQEVTYRFGGRQLGFTGNNNKNAGDQSFEDSLVDRRQNVPPNQGTFRNKQVSQSPYADFAQSFDPINSYQQGSTPGGYTVQSGDTLQGIAYQVWGDGALWYKLAEANGLSMASPLIAGTQLTLPAGVLRTGYNAATMRPYDPADALGNVVPDTSAAPAPAARKKSNKCGVFGAILLAVVAVAVAVVAGPGIVGAAQGLLAGGGAVAAGSAAAIGGAVLGGAAAGALGSIASQAVGLATGIQDKFSFKGVALAALAGGVGGGLGEVIGGSGFVAGAARGALGNAITQGIATATGLQDKFDWAGVAAAGLGGGVGSALSPSIAKARLGEFGTRAATVSAISITEAATRSAIEGSSFGQNLLAAVPGAVGQVVGGAIGEALGKVREAARATRPLERANVDPKTGRGATGVGRRSDGARTDTTGERLATGVAESSGGGRGSSSDAVLTDFEPLGAGNATSMFDGNDIVITANPDVRSQANGSSAIADTLSLIWQVAGQVQRAVATELAALDDRYQITARYQRFTAAEAAFDRRYQVTTRLFGAFQAAGGFAEIVGGSFLTGLGVAGEPLTFGASTVAVIGGVATVGFGIDNTQAGLRAAITGRSTNTLGGQAVSTVTGLSATEGELAYGAAQVVTGVGAGVALSRVSAIAAEGTVVGGGSKLLPGEGLVGTYDDLIAAGVKGDNITPHHIPSANRMSLEGVSRGNGIAINMEQPFPGVGGRHRSTFTYGTQADIAMTPRDALAAGIRDARQIYRADGLYTPEIRSSLQDVIRMNKANHPTIFTK